ncbi:MAG: CRISPR-associated RAMP protein Csx7 [Fimbriimonadales bacterium]|nr:CRISPR-associated RAMP protein Csx7 [Fimbriimonadales bacterium]
MVWQRFENRLYVRAELVAETGLRVGAGGETALPTATDLPVMRTPEGKPFIPGSSLRGALRSHIERIVRSFEPQVGNGKGACNPTRTSEWCIRSEERKELDATQVYQRSCRVCQVFGSPWLASRVRLRDLYLAETTADAMPELRDSVAIDREKESVANKFDFEALPAGVRFTMEVVAENLNPAELGLLLVALRELERGEILLGGFKGRGLGCVRLEKIVFEWIPREKLKDYLLNGITDPLSDAFQQECIEAFLNALGRE